MPSSTRQTSSPILVTRRPESSFTASLAPSSPPKAVRFAGRSSELVTGVSRPCTPVEEWSLYHFETHARACSACRDPYSVYLANRPLCPTGHALAQDVAMLVCKQDNEVYSTKKEDHKLVRVEIPHGHVQVRSLLRAMDRGTRRAERVVPIISYDANYPISARRAASLLRREPESRAQAIVEPASTSRKSKHRSERYAVQRPEYPSSTATTVDEASQVRRRETDEKIRRGSLYEADMSRPRKEYRVEERVPAEVEKRRERRREKERPREGDGEREERRERGREERRWRRDNR